MSADKRVIASQPEPEDAAEIGLRPQTLDDFIGQQKQRENLRIFVQAAKARREPLDHVLLHGPPGLGKTTLAQIVAREMGVGFRATSGPVIQRAGDLAALLTNLQPHDVLFIDEIHRLAPAVEEVLYPAIEDFQLDIIIGEGPAARSMRIDLQPFTLVGATTRSGLITRPLRERFGIPLRLDFYDRGRIAPDRVARRRPSRHAARARRRRRDRVARARDAPSRRPAVAPRARFRRRLGRETDRRQGGGCALRRLDVDKQRTRRDRPAVSTCIVEKLWWRAGRGRDAGRGAGGRARRDRGSDRALSHAARSSCSALRAAASSATGLSPYRLVPLRPPSAQLDLLDDDEAGVG